MLKKIILCSMIFTFMSCSTRQDIEAQIYNCLATKIEKRPAGSSEEFFNYLKETESITIKNKFLSNSTKQSYLSFFDTLNNKENHAKEVNQNINESVFNDFNFNLGFIHASYKECHIGLNISDKEAIKRVNNKLKIYDTLESKGFDDYNTFIKLINDTNFQNEKERLMLFGLIQIFIYNKITD